MKIKQLASMTLFTSLLFVAYPGGETYAANSDTTVTEKTTQQHSGVFSGALLETFNSGGYTYAQIKTENGPVWAAGPITRIKNSDEVSFIGKVAMFDFYSKSLDRRFETIYFVEAYIINGVKTGTMVIDPHTKINKKQITKLKTFDKAKDGQSIAEILKSKDKFAAKTVRIRGQVNKYTANVMGKNWLHIRDSSSDQDITITTAASAQLNDIITAEGQLVLNKDYGYGYIYEVLIEDAKVSIE